jgi:hypothetical protein
MGLTSALRPVELPNPDGLTDDLSPGCGRAGREPGCTGRVHAAAGIPPRHPPDTQGAALFDSWGARCATCGRCERARSGRRPSSRASMRRCSRTSCSTTWERGSRRPGGGGGGPARFPDGAAHRALVPAGIPPRRSRRDSPGGDPRPRLTRVGGGRRRFQRFEALGAADQEALLAFRRRALSEPVEVSGTDGHVEHLPRGAAAQVAEHHVDVDRGSRRRGCGKRMSLVAFGSSGSARPTGSPPPRRRSTPSCS